MNLIEARCRSCNTLLVLFILALLAAPVVDAGVYQVNGTQYREIWDGSYVDVVLPPVNITQTLYGHEVAWAGGKYALFDDGVYNYDLIVNASDDTLISTNWFSVQSQSNTGQKLWQYESIIANDYQIVDDKTIKRIMTLDSGGKFNITYHFGWKIKMDFEVTAGYNRNYAVEVRQDMPAGQSFGTINNNSKRYSLNDGRNFTFYDWTDIPEYQANATTGAYISGFNFTQWIDTNGRRFYQKITIPYKLNISETVLIDPLFSINGSTTPAWGNTTYDGNGSMNYGNNFNTVGIHRDNFNDNNLNAGWNTSYKTGSSLTYTIADGIVNITDTSPRNPQSWVNYPSQPRSKGSVLWRPNLTLPQYWEANINVSSVNVATGVYQTGVMAIDSTGVIYSIQIQDGNTGTANEAGIITDYTTDITAISPGGSIFTSFQNITIRLNSSGYSGFWNKVLKDTNTTVVTPTDLVVFIGAYATWQPARTYINEFVVWALNSSGQKQLSSNFTHYYDLGTGRRGYRAMVNYTPAGTVNLYASADNVTYSLVNSGIANATWSSEFASGDKNQTQYIKVELVCSNEDNCPEEMKVQFEDESSTSENFMPPTPVSLTYTNGTETVNHTWLKGSGNDTDYFNVLHNDVWTNGSSNTFFNATVGVNSYSNISVYSYNSSGTGTLNETPVSQNIKTPDVYIESCNGFYTGTIVYSGNCSTLTNLSLKLNNVSILNETSDGNFFLDSNLTINSSTVFYINSSDTFYLKINSSLGEYNILTNLGTLIINNTKISSWNTTSNSPDIQVQSDYVRNPQAYIIASGSGAVMNITNSWIEGFGHASVTEAGSYVSGVSWYNGATGIADNNTFLNVFRVIPHLNSATTISNNTIIINNSLFSDPDGIALYDTGPSIVRDNNINLSTINAYGVLIWYGWDTGNQIINNTIITNSTGAIGIRVFQTSGNTFTNNNVSVSGTGVTALQFDNGAISNIVGGGSYISTGTNGYGIGLYSNTNASYDQVFNISVSNLTTSGYINDIRLVGSYQNSTFKNVTLGHNRTYFEDGISNYNQSVASDIYINTNFSETVTLNRSVSSWTLNNISFNDSVVISQDKTASYSISGLTPSVNYSVYNGSDINHSAITDENGVLPQFQFNLSTVPTLIKIIEAVSPASITNNQTITGNFYVNNTWINPVDADFNHTMFKYVNGTILQNVSTTFLNLTWSPHYEQNISAQTVDTSGNINETKVWFNITIPDNPIIISGITEGQEFSLNEGETFYADVNYSDADNDIGTFYDNSSEWNIGISTGIISWVTVDGDQGIYSYSVNVTNATYNSISIVNFTVTVLIVNNPPTAPTLTSDLNMSEVNHNPIITFTKGTDADNDTVTTYIYVDTTNPPTTQETFTTANNTTIGSTTPLLDGITYYVRARSWDGTDWSGYSAIDTFKMAGSAAAFNFTNQTLSETQIYQSSGVEDITVDINSSLGTISSATVTISYLSVDFIYAMTQGSGDTWTYSFKTSAAGTYTVKEFNATDSAMNTDGDAWGTTFTVVPVVPGGSLGVPAPNITASTTPTPAGQNVTASIPLLSIDNPISELNKAIIKTAKIPEYPTLKWMFATFMIIFGIILCVGVVLIKGQNVGKFSKPSALVMGMALMWLGIYLVYMGNLISELNEAIINITIIPENLTLKWMFVTFMILFGVVLCVGVVLVKGQNVGKFSKPSALVMGMALIGLGLYLA